MNDDSGAILQLLNELSVKIDRNYEQQRDWQKDHQNADDVAFQKIDDSFEKLHIKAAEDAGEAKATAKLWGIGGATLLAVLDGSWELIKHFWVK